MEIDDDNGITYRFDEDLDLDDLIQSAIEDLCNPNTCPQAKEWTDDLTKLQAKFKPVERRQKEINRMFSDCQLQLDNFKENLEEAEKDEEAILLKAKNEFSKTPSEVIIEASSDEEDDDVQFIQKTFNPDIAAKNKTLNNNNTRSPEVNSMVKSDLQAQTRDKLTAALNNAGASQPSGRVQEIRSHFEKSVSMQLQNTLKLSSHPQPTSSLIAKPSSSLSFHPVNQMPAPPAQLQAPAQTQTVGFGTSYTSGTNPATLSALQRKVAGQAWPNYSTSIANQEKMEKLYLDDVKKYKVKCDSKKMGKTLTSKQIAFGWSLTKPVTVGTRIVALYKEDDSEGAFYAGIVAEAPNGRNGLRYLVFFDDGYAQYCTSKEIYKVFYQSKPVWEDIHPDTQDFVRDYLAQYPERPMVRLHKGQSVKTEWNGKWWNARVEEVDASLVSMYFSADQRNEWIYRGSTRLEPLYTALANAEANRNAGKVKRHNVASTGPKKPVVEYTRNNSTESPAKPDKKKAVAKKSTTPQTGLDTGKIWEAPWLKKKPPVDVKPSIGPPPPAEKFIATTISTKPAAKEKDIASVLQERLVPTEDAGTIDLESLGTRLDQVVPFNDRNKTKYVRHLCQGQCVSEVGDDPEKFKGNNPLLIPLFMGWERHVSKLKPSGRRVIFYRAPCGRRLRTLEELDRYLEMTDCVLCIDNFCYDTELHVNYEFIPVKTFCDIKDISYGKENVPISCVNGIDRQYPDYVEYSNQRIPALDVKLNLEPNFLVCCDCTDNCRDKSKCSCQQLTVEASAITNGGKPQQDAGYKHRRLLEPLVSGVYECNSRCGCDRRCVNRVVQNGLQNRLQVFKTEKRGWGLRCLDDIPMGGFICIYAGQLLTDQGANEDGQQYGDEYLAELDYMEVVEGHKEGYESDVEDIDDMENNDDEDDADDESNDDTMASDSDDSFSKQNKQKIDKPDEKSHQTRRSSRRVNNKEDSRESHIQSSDSKSSNRNTETKRSKQTAQKSTTMLPRNGPQNNSGDKDDSVLSSPNTSSEVTDGEPKKKRTGRSTAARYGSMVPTKKDKDKDDQDTEETKFMPTRYYFRDDQSCYIMDAKSMGNIGRYLNHSCQPCAFVQNVFVDTHDLRFPWIAFFAGQYISAGTELTWDYNYEVGSVPGKCLYCYCGSAECFNGFSRHVLIGNTDNHRRGSRLDEPSGIGASRKHHNILHAHDDENDEVAVYAIDARTGTVVARFDIRYATNLDWEDMAVGPCGHNDHRSCIYILDDGIDRSEGIYGQATIYKIVEPNSIQNYSLPIEAKLEYNWPGKISNTLMVDPNGEVYIIDVGSGHRVKMARLPYNAWNRRPVNIDSSDYFGVIAPSNHAGPDGADISPNGEEIVVINDGTIYHFKVKNGNYLESLSERGTPITWLTNYGTSMGVCWSTDGRSIYVIDELTDNLFKLDKL